MGRGPQRARHDEKACASPARRPHNAGYGRYTAATGSDALHAARRNAAAHSTTAPSTSLSTASTGDAMLLMIDNYDSFTYNLVQYLGELGEDVRVFRNDALTVADIEAMKPDRIVISPGPGTPDDAGVSLDLLRTLGGRVPILGVCLGHQSLGQAFGGRVIRAKTIMHGKTSMIRHHGGGVFRGLPDPFEATRYHSLVVEQSTLPECLEVTAWTERADGGIDEIMGLRHRELAIEGVQFHPESILTRSGMDLLRNVVTPLPRAA
jgi:anthranilate synthase component 2